MFRVALASGSLSITCWTTDWANESSNPAQYVSHPPPPYRLPIGIDWSFGVPNDWGKEAIGHYHAITTKDQYVTTTAESWAIPIWPIDGVLLGLATIWLFAVYRNCGRTKTAVALSAVTISAPPPTAARNAGQYRRKGKSFQAEPVLNRGTMPGNEPLLAMAAQLPCAHFNAPNGRDDYSVGAKLLRLG